MQLQHSHAFEAFGELVKSKKSLDQSSKSSVIQLDYGKKIPKVDVSPNEADIKIGAILESVANPLTFIPLSKSA